MSSRSMGQINEQENIMTLIDRLLGRGGAVPESQRDATPSRFSPGLCDELVDLSEAHRDHLMSEKFRFGLKQFGSLYVLDRIKETRPARVLEMGAGCNRYFDRAVGEICDYWVVDDAGFYAPEQFEAAAKSRQHTRFVNGLVGGNVDELPENHFDLIFSVSVLEHVPPEDIEAVSDHMLKLLKPGGRIVHSLDVPVKYFAHRTEAWSQALANSGFDVPKPSPLSAFGESKDGAVLVEPLHIVHEYYGKAANIKESIKPEWHHTTYIIDAGKRST